MKGRTGLPRGRVASLSLYAALLLAAYAVAVWRTGGFEWRVAGLRLRSHEWVRPCALAILALAVSLWADRGLLPGRLDAAWRALDRPAGGRALTAVALLWIAAAGVQFNTFAAGGADSYGYVGQARLFAEGRLTDSVPIAREFTWPGVEYTLRPLAFTRGRTPGEIAPVYPPGLSLLLAPLSFAGDRALFLLVPAFGLLAAWATFRLGCQLGDPLAGGLAALLLSVSPTFLFQLVQPMSDVPAAACWLVALVLAWRASSAAAAGAGVAVAVAILIRPNLAPLAAIVGGLLARPAGGAARRLLVFTACVLPGLVLLGWIQDVRYGSPLASGYGTIRDGFSLSNVVPNLARYPAWVTTTHTPFIWLSLLAPFWLLRRETVRRGATAAILIAAGVWCAYLPYVPFQPDEWFYTRFLLPAIALMLLLAAATATMAVRRMPSWLRAVVLASLAIGLVSAMLQSAQVHGVFEIRAQESKYPRAGAFVREHLPPTAFVFAMQHSGSIRYYSGRSTIRWDLLDAGALDKAVADLRAAGHEPFVVVDAGEDAAFRRKFEETGQAAIRQLEPVAALGDARVYAFR